MIIKISVPKRFEKSEIVIKKVPPKKKQRSIKMEVIK